MQNKMREKIEKEGDRDRDPSREEDYDASGERHSAARAQATGGKPRWKWGIMGS